MKKGLAFLLLAVAGCNTAMSAELVSKDSSTIGTPNVTVEMTSATLADDCGDPAPSPPSPVRKKERSEMDMERKDSSSRGFAAGARARRSCEQTSMQLSVISASGGTATELRVKKVEFYDDAGKLLGELTPRSPRVWAETGAYDAWDEKIAPGKHLQVTYALSQPNWSVVNSRWDRTFVVKAVITVGGGAEQTLQRDVHVSAMTSLPPNVRT